MGPEEAILACILVEPKLFHESIGYGLKPDDFIDLRNRQIYDTLCKMVDQGTPIGLLTVVSTNPSIDAEYLSSLLDIPIAVAHLKEYVKAVIDRAVKFGAQDLTEDIADPGLTGFEVLERIEEFVGKSSRYNAGRLSFTEVVEEVVESVSSGTINSRGLETGFKDLDRLILGLKPGNFIVLAGRPGMGKTSLALNIAEEISVHREIPVGIVSLEMSREEMIVRLISSLCNIPNYFIQTGRLDEAGRSRLKLVELELKNAPLYIEDDCGIKLPEVRSCANVLKRKHGIELLIVDYLQLMTMGGKSSREQEVAEISRRMKELARSLDIPVIGLSQLNRAVELRKDRRPTLSDLRESGALEQDADIVLFVYRESYYGGDVVSMDAEVICQKNRNGVQGTVYLNWNPDLTRFEQPSMNEFAQKVSTEKTSQEDDEQEINPSESTRPESLEKEKPPEGGQEWLDL